MADKQEYLAVYTADSDGRPVAIFRDAAAAQRYRAAEHGGAAYVGTVEMTLPRNADVADMLAPPAPVEAPVAPTGEDRLRAEIRAQEMDARNRERIRAEVRKELDDAERAKPATREVRG